jgi:dTDP-glucose 4,6-dehydratase
MPLDSSFACGNFINNALQKQSIVIRSDGKSTRSYLYTADLVIWLIKCLIVGKKLTPYNIGADQEISIIQLAKEVAKNFEHRVNIEFDAKTESKNSRYIPNNKKALNDLDIKSYFSFEKSIQRTVEYYKNE